MAHPPTTSYLICATPRTGSYLLCDALAATGLAGQPTEYLMPQYRDHWMAEWGVSTYREYHERVRAAGTSSNGVFGAKIHSGQFLGLLQQTTGRARIPMEERGGAIAEWFPNPHYVWLRRRDRVDQAVSWTKACQTRMWWDADAPPAPMDAPRPDAARFDYHAIERSLYALSDWDGVWRTFFDANAITPLTVWYEDLVGDLNRETACVLDYLAVGRARDPAPAAVPHPAFRRQADTVSHTWAGRFRRLQDAKREGTLASLAGLHTGESVYVCTGTAAVDAPPHDAVTVAVDGAASPTPASFALLTRPPIGPPAADVVLTTQPIAIDHPFVVRCLLNDEPGLNHLRVDPHATDAEVARALAAHLGAARIERA